MPLTCQLRRTAKARRRWQDLTSFAEAGLSRRPRAVAQYVGSRGADHRQQRRHRV